MLDLTDVSLSDTEFSQPIAAQIWKQKYRYVTGGREIDKTLADTWSRTARSLAKAELPEHQEKIMQDFLAAFQDFKLLPAGRILAGIGTHRKVTLCNTFVMRDIPDSVEGIMAVFTEAAQTMQMGGGIGFDFSSIRPRGTLVQSLDCGAGGPLPAMDICDKVGAMFAPGMRRGAMMATMRVDHPDIFDFIQAKSDPARFRNFNLSVLISDAFMAAEAKGVDWPLTWKGRVIKTVPARALWETIMRQTYAAAEPGVLFIDRINNKNPLRYLEQITATNSCAEQPLPPNGACPLASVNLARLVQNPFQPDAQFDAPALWNLTGVAVRMLDNVIDLSRFAIPEQRQEVLSKRRIGIGVTGVANALAMLNVRYGSDRAVRLVEGWMQTIQNAAYMASANLACERGTFPLYDSRRHLNQPALQALDPAVRDAIAKHGLRNGVLTSVAPTGTISMFAGNVSSGIEPTFATSYTRKIIGPNGERTEETVEDYAAKLFRATFGNDAPLPASFVTAQELQPEEHVRMQAAAQKWVDSGISKTVNCPEDISFADFESVYRLAYESGCKGCTTYRPNEITGSVLST